MLMGDARFNHTPSQLLGAVTSVQVGSKWSPFKSIERQMNTRSGLIALQLDRRGVRTI